MSGRNRSRRLLRIPRPAGQQATADLRDEFALHLELRAQELEAEGMSPEEARREALRLFGDPEHVRREMLRAATRDFRRQRGREAIGSMIRELRYAARSLRRSPGFTTVALATLALGIGLTTAIFSVVDAVLLEPLPVPQPERLAMIYEASDRSGPEDRNVVNPANFVSWRERSRTFESMAAVFTLPVTVLQGGTARQVPAQLSHTDLFRVLGARPHIGRTFTAEEGVAEPGAAQVVVLSHGFWTDAFGGDSAAVGRTLEIVGAGAEIIGVMGPELEFFAPDVAFWMPTDYAWADRSSMGRFTLVVGRLAQGATMASAESEIVDIAAALRAEHPEFNATWSANVVPLDEVVKGDVRPALLLLLAAVGMLLLVTAVNMANLLLVRASTRRTEIAVRASLGAGRGRIVAGLLSESLLLSVAGAAIGVAIAFAATRVLVVALPASLEVPRLDQAAVDVNVLAFAAMIAVATGVVFGLAPAFDAFRTQLIGQLRAGGRGAGGGHRARRLQSAIVVAEIALSLVLLIGAGLLVRSFVELQRTEIGLDPRGAITGRITMQGERYEDGDARSVFLQRSIESLASLPDVRAAGAIAWLPLAGGWSGDGFYLPGEPVPTAGSDRPTEVQAVEGDVFGALGMRIVRGRGFTDADDAAGRPVVIVNQALADATWPGEDPIGKQMILTWGEPTLLQVVGVVGDVRQRTVQERSRASVYRPYSQFPEFGSMALVVRASDGSAGRLAREMVRRIQEIDATMAVADIENLGQVVAAATVRPRLTSLLVAAFAGLAMLLAGLGIYGVLAYAVSLRTQEIGLRQALGARASEIARLVLRDGLVLTGIGLLIGAALAAAGSRIIASQLYQVSPRDPIVFIVMPAILVAIALLAAAIPALRAARVTPTSALRQG